MSSYEDDFKRFASNFPTIKDAISFLETHDNDQTLDYLETIGFHDTDNSVYVDGLRLGFMKYMNNQLVKYGNLDLSKHIDLKEYK